MPKGERATPMRVGAWATHGYCSTADLAQSHLLDQIVNSYCLGQVVLVGDHEERNGSERR
jgi:hypothetical protein